MTEHTPTRPERRELAPGLIISRVVTGLWQVADMERDRGPLDLDRAAAALRAYADAGFDTFDMADHYGSAEEIAGRMLLMPAGGQTPCGADQMVPRARRHDARRGTRRHRPQPGATRASSGSTCCSSTGGCSTTRAISTPCAGWPSSRTKATSPIWA